ncbi:hypothetical protein HETIRDRAFT_165974 [Heterobasidion irregulare TC 32-1]|uniref:HNH nuclease domain-containing protein n=1 Tax=Heterobasidion irregulare (strain TC 32-1) TaxID=747525 RepID=W4KL75_HETIT|nr:uncharacterized protein HETIRDRAFT_165974 [Heterobasidion irregulare TC 32-1]ETW86454.1 hypothetical protein HETIRDRAFT_165974 [Heterobasidion irregulare TC 32-1]
MSSSYHQTASVATVASHRLRQKPSFRGSIQSKSKIHDLAAGSDMHNGRKSTKATTRVSKSVVLELDPTGGQCLLTRELDDEAPLEFAHIFPRCEMNNDDLITNLERAWGIGHRCFNIDDARNLLLLKVDWHRLFDAKRWLLLPSPDMVTNLHNHTEGNITLRYNGATKFEYKMVPLGSKRIMDVYRHSRPDGADEESSASSYKYPFRNLPTLESHVQPHWVVLNAGMKLDSRSECEMDAFYERVADAYTISRDDAIDFIQTLIALNTRWRSPTVANDATPQEVASLKVALPKVSLPKVALPRVMLPKVALPKVALPKVTLPKVALPKVALPKVARPKVARPKVARPKVVSPEVALSKVAPPQLASPQVALSQVASLQVASPESASLEVALPKVASFQVAPPQVASVQVASPEVVLSKVASLQVTSPQVASPQVASPQVASPQVASPQVASPQVASPQVASPQVASPQVASPQVASPQVASPQVASPQVASPQVASPQVASPQVASPQVTSPQVTSPQVTSPQVTSPEGASTTQVVSPEVVDVVDVVDDISGEGKDSRSNKSSDSRRFIKPMTTTLQHYLHKRSSSSPHSPSLRSPVREVKRSKISSIYSGRKPKIT